MARLIVDERGDLVGIVAQADLARSVGGREAGDVVEKVSMPGEDASRPSRF